MHSNLITKTYYMADTDGREAKIVFDAVAPGEFTFTVCEFKGVGKQYSLKDWKFLGEVANQIGLLQGNEDGEEP
jgi:hypothetical protein